MNKGTLEYFKNETSLGVAFFGIHQSVRACVTGFGMQNLTLESPAWDLLGEERRAEAEAESKRKLASETKDKEAKEALVSKSEPEQAERQSLQNMDEPQLNFDLSEVNKDVVVTWLYRMSPSSSKSRIEKRKGPNPHSLGLQQYVCDKATLAQAEVDQKKVLGNGVTMLRLRDKSGWIPLNDPKSPSDVLLQLVSTRRYARLQDEKELGIVPKDIPKGGFVWHPKKKTKLLILKKGCRELNFSRPRWETAIGSEVFYPETGVYAWRIKLDRVDFKKNRWGVVVGVVPSGSGAADQALGMVGNPGWGFVIGVNKRVTGEQLYPYHNHRLSDMLSRPETKGDIATLPLESLPPSVHQFALRSLKGKSLRDTDVFTVPSIAGILSVKEAKQGYSALKQLKTGMQTVLCDPVWESGIHYVHVKFQRKGNDGKFGFTIGVVDAKTSPKECESKDVGALGWAVNEQGKKSKKGILASYMGKTFDTSDSMIVEIDMNNSSIRFAHNKQWLAVAYEGIPERVRFAISLRFQGTQCQVRNRTSFGFDVQNLNFKDYSTSKLSLKQISSGVSIARLIPQMTEGRQEFQVRVRQFVDLGSSQSEEDRVRHIGIIKPNITNFSNSSVGSVGWALLSNGKTMKMGAVKDYLEGPLKADDVVTVAIDTEARTLSFIVNGVNKGEAFNDIPPNFFAALSLSTPGDGIDVVQMTLPKPKLKAVGQGSGEVGEELQLLSEIKESVLADTKPKFCGKFYPINVRLVGERITSAHNYDVKDRIFTKTSQRQFTAVMKEHPGKESTPPIDYGKRFYSFRLSSGAGKAVGLNCIGVVDADEKTPLNVNTPLTICGWAIHVTGKHIFKTSRTQPKAAVYVHETVFDVNDIITIQIDIKKRAMSALLNGHDLGVAFTDLPAQVWPAFSLERPGMAIEVMSPGRGFAFDTIRRGNVSLFNDQKTALLASESWQTIQGSMELLPNTGAYTWDSKYMSLTQKGRKVWL